MVVGGGRRSGKKEGIDVMFDFMSLFPQIPCDQDQSCQREDFCDKHFGVCVPLRQEGSRCRRDPQCSEGLSCMYGQCHPIIPPGQEGARCKLDADCGPALCCARHHGEMICKRRLVMGEDCYVPDGGLAYSINQVCPCEEGLVCRNGERTREKEFDYWTDTESWQCLSPSS
uniref:Dickkopf-related protein 1-like n=1 Tax=Callorhinchus milii TaxID=7868 RepID=V9LGQ4_CALMI